MKYIEYNNNEVHRVHWLDVGGGFLGEFAVPWTGKMYCKSCPRLINFCFTLGIGLTFASASGADICWVAVNIVWTMCPFPWGCNKGCNCLGALSSYFGARCTRRPSCIPCWWWSCCLSTLTFGTICTIMLTIWNSVWTTSAPLPSRWCDGPREPRAGFKRETGWSSSWGISLMQWIYLPRVHYFR